MDEDKRESPDDARADGLDDTGRRVVELARSMSLIDPDVETDPAMIKRVREIAEKIPAATLRDILAVMDDASARGQPDITSFCARHGISVAEERLLASIVDGKTVADHAASKAISINTARTHMRRLLEKTGASNQVDLVRLYFTS